MRRRSGTWFARHSAAAVFTALTLAAGAASPADSKPSSPVQPVPAGPQYVPGEILVKFRRDSPSVSRGAVRADVAGAMGRRFASGAELWRLGAGVEVEAALAQVRSSPEVEYAEPNYLLHTARAPNDPLFDQQWPLLNTGQAGGRAGSDIDATGAWNTSTGGESVVVAIVDTGIDLDHPDLAPNLWINPDEIPGNLVDDDGDGRVDDVHGWDFVNHDAEPRDDNGHGTHVAGTIGAVGDNGLGITGVAWRARLMPLKFLDNHGTGNTADAIQAIDYAVAHGARVLNASWGGRDFSQAMLETIRDAGAHQLLFVAAAGNDGSDSDRLRFFPAGYDARNIVAVAATDRQDRLAPFSNYGATTVDVAAPGVDVLSTLPGGTYGLSSGTSMATPHVSGVAALILGFRSDVPAESLRSRLLERSEPVAALAGRVAVSGRINAERCLFDADNASPGPIADLRVVEPLSDGFALAWTATGDDGALGTAAAYDVRVSEQPFDAGDFAAQDRAPVAGSPLPGGSPETKEVGRLAPSRTYYLAVRAIDEWGNAGAPGFTSGTTLPPPGMKVSPDSASGSVRSAQSTTRLLTVRNISEGTLDWSIERPILHPRVSRGSISTERFSGPDGFGYQFIDSDEPDGPLFAWRDITATGRSALIFGDDVISAPIAIGFEFPFYGQSFTRLRIASNGFLTFTGDDPAFDNRPLPSPASPGNFVAGFWDDLNVFGLQEVVWLAEPHTFTVQYTGVLHVGSDAGGPYTFQIALFDSGEILFQYLEMKDPLDSATIGIQDALGTAGLPIAFNAPYVHDRLAVRLSVQRDWVIAAPPSGRLRAGESASVTLTFDGSGLAAGTYEGLLPVVSNDPILPRVELPVSLSVTDARGILAEPVAIDFGTIFTKDEGRRSVAIVNSGSLPLVVASAVPDNPDIVTDFAPLTLASGEKGIVNVAWLPAAPSALSSGLHVQSDAENAPSLVVPLRGNAVNRTPKIAVHPDGVDFGAVFTKDGGRRELEVVNSGSLPLVASDAVADDRDVGSDFAPFTLAPGEARVLNLVWLPSTPGALNAGLRITSDAENAPSLFVPLQGNALNPPIAAANWPSAQVECATPQGSDVLLDGTPSQSEDPRPGRNVDIVLYEWIENPGEADERILATGRRVTKTLPLGTHRLALRITDARGETDSIASTITVVDTLPPELRLATSPANLRRPNNLMVPVRVDWIVVDACSAAVDVRLFEVSSSEPGNTGGDGDIEGLDPGTADHALLLRAEREPNGQARVYTLRYVATDAVGHATVGEAFVTVARGKRVTARR